MVLNSTYGAVLVKSCGIASYLASYPTPRIVTANTIVIVFDTFLAVFTVITNALFISTYLNNRILQNTSNTLLVVLAISDVLVGVLAEPISIIRAAMEIAGTHNCVLFNISRLVIVFCSGLSFFTVTVITHDRYIAVYYPLQYTRLFNKARIKLIFSVCGILLVALLLCRAFLRLELFFIIICCLTFYTTVSALVVYSKILLAARRQKIQILYTLRSSQFYRPRISLHEIKTTNVMVCVLGAMIVCYYPGTCFWIYSAFNGYTMESMYTVVPYLETALFLNSAINPVTYLLRSRTIRGAFLRNFSAVFNSCF